MGAVGSSTLSLLGCLLVALLPYPIPSTTTAHDISSTLVLERPVCRPRHPGARLCEWGGAYPPWSQQRDPALATSARHGSFPETADFQVGPMIQYLRGGQSEPAEDPPPDSDAGDPVVVAEAMETPQDGVLAPPVAKPRARAVSLPPTPRLPPFLEHSSDPLSTHPDQCHIGVHKSTLHDPVLLGPFRIVALPHSG